MRRSFRRQLALRSTATMALAVTGLAVAGFLVLRATLDRQVDASLQNVASIQAGSVTDAPSGRMHFHEWNLTPAEARSVRSVVRYSQVWSRTGESLLRSQFLDRDLPLDTAALRRAVGGELTTVESRFQGTEIRSLYYPLGRLGDEHTGHVLQVAASLEPRNGTLRTAGLLLAGVVLLVTAGTFGGSWWLAGRVVRPVHEITRQAEEIEASTLDRRIEAYADTIEYDRLVDVLNGMLDRIDRAFEGQRRFTADASHELRSPLTALRAELELALRREREPEEYRRVIESSLEETDRLESIAGDLLTLARSDAGVMEPDLQDVRLGELVRDVADRLRGKAAEKEIRLETEVPGEPEILADADLLRRAVRNLTENAVKFTTPGGRITIRVERDDGTVAMAVEDTGPGVREEEMEQIFQRFYQSDAARGSEGGSGLGLSIVRAVVNAHDGRVSVENRDEGGARFSIRLPSG